MSPNDSVRSSHAPAPVRRLAPERPLVWIRRGWRDFRAAPALGIAHGAAFLGGGLAIGAIGWGRFDLLAGAFSGFLLVAPLLLAGLYAISRDREAGLAPALAGVIAAWRVSNAALVRLGLLLALLGTLWVALSVLIITGWSQARGGVSGFVFDFVLATDWRPFALWLLAGGVFAALVFAMSAVSVPMLVDREASLRCALLTSVRAVGGNPEAMIVWAAIVMVTAVVSVALVLPLLVLVPVLGHATWHAYREAVQAEGLPRRR
jgi:uncharacterized membrane protein